MHVPRLLICGRIATELIYWRDRCLVLNVIGLTQESVGKGRIFVVSAASVQVEGLGKEGAEKVKVRYLLDERQGSERFALRLYTVEKGGHTPLDQHQYEHQVYIVSGQGLLKQSKEDAQALRTLRTGDAMFIPSNAVHQFINERDEPFVFLCVKGNPKLYVAGGRTTVPDDSARNFC
jgi:quercetin dioxygenase-like cupin family protein